MLGLPQIFEIFSDCLPLARLINEPHGLPVDHFVRADADDHELRRDDLTARETYTRHAPFSFEALDPDTEPELHAFLAMGPRDALPEHRA